VDSHVIEMEKESLKLVQAIDRAGATRPAAVSGIFAAGTNDDMPAAVA
jgi:hypothetical protein